MGRQEGRAAPGWAESMLGLGLDRPVPGDPVMLRPPPRWASVPSFLQLSSDTQVLGCLQQS